MRDPRLGVADFDLDADGRLLTETLPHGSQRSYDYENGVLARYRQHGIDLPGQDITIERNPDGQITREVAPGNIPLHEYAYDAGGRLISARGGVDVDTQFGYDPDGNLIQVTRGQTVTSMSYDDADQLITSRTNHQDWTVSSTDYRYDASGKLLSVVSGNRATTFTYDGFGQQSAAVTSNGPLAASVEQTLIHNGDGLLASITTSHRLATTVLDQHQQNYTWSVGDTTPQLMTQRTPDPAGRIWDADFEYGYGRIFAATKTGGATFARDVLGSAQLTAVTAPWVQAPAYDALGKAVLDPGPPLDDPRFGYRGELTLNDAVDMRARSYDTTTGRFTTKDPLDLLPGRIQVENPYSYADNDPINRSDPSGQASIAAGPGAGGGIGRVFTGDLVDRLVKVLQDDTCPDPGNSIDRHPKCFQNVLYRTRGYFTIPAALDKDDTALNTYWQSGQRERAAQAVTIHELNWNREGTWDSFKDKFGAATKISPDVDWEVGPSWGAYRIDIVTDEKDIFEVKEWHGAATASEVRAQLTRYVSNGARDRVSWLASTELDDWVDSFTVDTSLWGWLNGNDKVYVWGFENEPGHIYFKQGDDAPSNVRAKRDLEDQHSCVLCFPIPIEAPVPVVPV